MIEYKKMPPEYPRRQRHYFKARPDEGMEYFDCWMDILVKDNGTITPIVDIWDFGCNIDGKNDRPVWLTTEMLNEEKTKVDLK